jgi:2-dehydro-3-deoxyphosphogalactonate aldolase
LTGSDSAEKFAGAIRALPLVAILRGLVPDEAQPVGAVLVQAGWRLLEVPLNSPRPLASIVALVQAFPDTLVGAGTVLSAAAVREVHAAGGQMIVAPNFNASVVHEARRLGMVCIPGVATPTEAFDALDAGASALKLFPAELVSAAALKAMRAVLDTSTVLLPVGGITPTNMAVFRAAGADGFGIGSALFQPGLAIASLRQNSTRFVAAWRALAG